MPKKMQTESRRLRRAKKAKSTMVRFMSSPKPHVYDPSGLGTCLKCGKHPVDVLHLHPHSYQRNYDSTLQRCMCGNKKEHPIHLARTK